MLRACWAGSSRTRQLLGLVDRHSASYQTAPGRGLPIGNLTSQHFANFYLAPLDRFLKEDLRRGAYVRHMDDFVVWGESGRELREVWERVRAFLTAELKLELKANTAINRTACGMDFLGYRLVPRHGAAGAAEQGAVCAEVPAL